MKAIVLSEKEKNLLIEILHDLKKFIENEIDFKSQPMRWLNKFYYPIDRAAHKIEALHNCTLLKYERFAVLSGLKHQDKLYFCSEQLRVFLNHKETIDQKRRLDATVKFYQNYKPVVY